MKPQQPPVTLIQAPERPVALIEPPPVKRVRGIGFVLMQSM